MYNRAILIGRLTADPELKQTPGGVDVCSFRIAVNRPYQSKDGEKQADFFSIVAWRQTASFVSRYFHKGDPILVEGSIQTREYTDRNGARHTVFEVAADHAGFVAGRRDNAPNPAAASPGTGGDFEEITPDGDLPF